MEGPAVLSLAPTRPLKPWVAIFLIFFAVSTVQAGTDFDQRLAEARRLYFANLQGNPAAGDQARTSSPTLRSGRDANSMPGIKFSLLKLLRAQLNCPPDRSEA